MTEAFQGYMLHVPPERRTDLRWSVEEWGKFGEPVRRFNHRRGSPFLVLLSSDGRSITHVADGKKGQSAGTDLVTIWLTNVHTLAKPLPFKSMVDATPSRVRGPLRARLEEGGLLGPKSLGAAVEVLAKLAPEIAKRIERYSGRRREFARSLSERSRTNLALQKEQLNAALRIAGMDGGTVRNWNPPLSGRISCYLDGLEDPPVREDLMIISDADVVPGFDLVERDVKTATKVFVQGSVKLSVTVANRQPLEAQTGADLIYFNETYQSFVMVQYKVMRREARQGTATHVYRPDNQLSDEIRRMDGLNEAISRIPPRGTLEEYRLNPDPFYLKLCKNTELDLDEGSLFGGMYLPLEYWKLLSGAPCTKGPRGGRVISYETVQRRLNNSQFIDLVASGFVGSRVYQSGFIRALVRKVLSDGKSVTLAVHSVADSEIFEDIRLQAAE